MNIWQIKQDLLNLYDELEENGGELTEELEEALLVTQENFENKVESYINVIKSVSSEVEAIKTEQKRLKDLCDRKQKSIDRLKTIVIDAIEQFGDVKKSGVKYLDYGTGQVSIRQTKAVDVNDEHTNKIANEIAATMKYAKEYNMLDDERLLDVNTLIDTIKESDEGFDVTEDDLNNVDVELSVKVPVKELLDNDGYPIIREMARFTKDFDVAPAISKSELKKKLEANGACAPNIAKLKTNKSISIK